MREKQQITYKRTPIRLSADFSAEILQARRECRDIFKVMKGESLQPRILYPARLSFRFGEGIKSFTEKQMLKEFNIKHVIIHHIIGGSQKEKREKKGQRTYLKI